MEKDGKNQLDWSCEKWRCITWSQGAEEYVNGRRTGLVTFCVETAFYNGLLKERYKAGYKRQEDKEEDVESHWMTLGKGEDILIWKRKLWIALCGELALEDALDLS
jgi:hypothetical protein